MEVARVIITPEAFLKDDYPPYVTVLRSHDRFYAAIMKWDDRQERYDLDWPSKFKHVTVTQAKIDAEAWAQKLGYEVRL
jgi:hypothetical protein